MFFGGRLYSSVQVPTSKSSLLCAKDVSSHILDGAREDCREISHRGLELEESSWLGIHTPVSGFDIGFFPGSLSYQGQDSSHDPFVEGLQESSMLDIILPTQVTVEHCGQRKSHNSEKGEPDTDEVHLSNLSLLFTLTTVNKKQYQITSILSSIVPDKNVTYATPFPLTPYPLILILPYFTNFAILS